MNPNVSQLNGLHKTYLRCVDQQMTQYLSGSAVARSDNKEVEFCANEKNSYFSFMKESFPEQFEPGVVRKLLL